MTPERWQQIDHLFHEALGYEPAQRDQFLKAACGDDLSLRDEVESLISSHADAVDFIEIPAGDVATEMLQAHDAGAPGQQIGNYRIVRHIGSGGMGEVYLADDTRLHRKIALKLLPQRFTADPDRVRRFEREARAASALNHPNIVTIHEIGQSGPVHFIATEFVEGKTLRQLIAGKALTLGEVLSLGIQIAEALRGAHLVGIVHRDIKPENIMVRPDGYLKILDFGLAKLTEMSAADSDSSTLLQSNPGLVMGTVQYMSPEQARGRKVDARTDIWSLGVVLFELLAGRVPFSGETASHIMVSLMEGEAPPLANFVTVPAELERIVQRALQKNKQERYQTADELVQDLKKLKQELQFEAQLQKFSEPTRLIPAVEERPARATSPPVVVLGTQPGHAVSSAEYIVNQVSRHKWTVVIAAALVLAVIIVAGYLYFQRAPQVHSLAVLPFNNTGNNPELEYLSDGLSESLTNNLSPVPGLTVIARYSSFKYKGKQPDPQEVGKSLGVDAIVMGSVNKVGENYLISVELINVSNRSHIWGKQYNRQVSDLLLVQSEISRQIADELRLQLTKAEEQQLARTQAINPQAYDLYLKGLALSNTGRSADRKKAIEYFEQATAVDPKYALAYVQLSRAYSDLITDNELPQNEFMPKSDAAAQKALAADPDLAEAHLVMALMKRNKWEWSAAETEVRRALELNPNLVQAHDAYATLLIIHGHFNEAVAEIKRAQQLDPLRRSVELAQVDILLLYGQNDQALEGAKQILLANPKLPGAHFRVGQLYMKVGRNAEAIDYFLEAIRLGDESGDAQLFLAGAYARAGQRDKALAILKRFETGELYSSPFGLSVLHLALGDKERMYAELEKAYAMRDQQLIWLRSAWEFEAVRSEPRFQSLVQRVGL